MSTPSDVALSHFKKLLSRDPMLRDLLSDALPGLARGPGFTPDVDVYETPGAHRVFVDLPGVAREQVHVRLEGARLVVEGERTAPAVDHGRARGLERGFGTFRREFLLPPDVDAERVEASLDDGVLAVTIPRVGGGSRDIPIGG